VRVEEFVLENRQLLVVQAELELQGVIGHPASLLEEGYDVVEYRHKNPSRLLPWLLHTLVLLLSQDVKPPERPAQSLYKRSSA
jgi:hypothetical protein